MLRDKQVTRRKIIDAVGTILAKHGLDKLGINSVAREAGVDKVLIYRYFGGLEQLLKAFAEESSAWSFLPPLTWKSTESAAGNPLAVLVSSLLRDQLNDLRRRPVAQEIIRWELFHKNTLTDQLALAREKQGKEFLTRLPFDSDRDPEIDLGAIYAILHAGLTHLVISARKTDYYQGIDLKSARGWRRVEKAIDALIDAYFNYHRIEPAKHGPIK